MARLLLLLVALPCLCAVSVTNGNDEGQACFVIATDNATYYYHKAGGGFSSILDKNGNDWVNFHPTPGPGGLDRGIPNLVYPGDLFHPGFSHCVSTLDSATPDKATIKSTTGDNGGWTLYWDIYSTLAVCRITKVGNVTYWFLYEGTPGGSLSTSGDYYVVPNGTKTTCANDKPGDLPSSTGGQGEWIYFGDNALSRVFFLAHHQNDTYTDYYKPYPETGSEMVCFAFGRGSGTDSYLNSAQTFSMGFIESTDHALISTAVNTIIGGATAVQTTPPSGSASLELSASPNPSRGAVKITLSAGQGPGEGGGTLRIFDIDGRPLKLIYADAGTLQNGVTWQLSDYPSGIYLLEAAFSSMLLRKKLILID